MLAETIKLLAQQQNDGTYPTSILFGTVKTINPLKVQIDSKIIVGEFLVVAEHLTKYDVEVELKAGTDHDATDESLKFRTRGSGTTSDYELCELKYNKGKLVIDNSLKAGDKVIVLRQQGGKKYIILDRIGG